MRVEFIEHVGHTPFGLENLPRVLHDFPYFSCLNLVTCRPKHKTCMCLMTERCSALKCILVDVYIARVCFRRRRDQTLRACNITCLGQKNVFICNSANCNRRFAVIFRSNSVAFKLTQNQKRRPLGRV